MSVFLCNIWPYLAGGLIGWLFSGWLARKLKYDNPEHIEKMGLLQKENSVIGTLRSNIQKFETDGVNHLKRISQLEEENLVIATLRSDITSYESKGVNAQKQISELETN
ncbi:MAG: hypothetical protein V3U84_03640, partial [Thiotrichaceae bacterium]